MMSVGTAASQFSDWPPHWSARRPTTWLATLRLATLSWRDAQHARSLVAGTPAVHLTQHDRVADFTMQQDLFFVFTATFLELSASQFKSAPARFAPAIANSGGRTPCLRAHARRSASVWQQHDLQHCSAELHPQPLVMQGKGSPFFGSRFADGSGMPAAVTTNAASSKPDVQRRKASLRPRRGLNGAGMLQAR